MSDPMAMKYLSPEEQQMYAPVNQSGGRGRGVGGGFGSPRGRGGGGGAFGSPRGRGGGRGTGGRGRGGRGAPVGARGGPGRGGLYLECWCALFGILVGFIWEYIVFLFCVCIVQVVEV